MVEKRHLPVIAAPATAEAGPPRSAARWISLGTLLVVAIWLPLGMLGLWLSRLASWALESLAMDGALGVSAAGMLRLAVGILPIIASFALAAVTGGAVVAHFGPRTAARHAYLTGGLAGAGVASLAAAQGALRPWQLGVAAYASMIAVGLLASAWGRRWGRGLGKTANLSSLTESRPSSPE